METSLRRRQECYFDVSWEPHDGAMDSSDASMSTYGFGRSQHIWLGKSLAERAKTRRTSATTIQNIPDSPDISLNDVVLLPLLTIGLRRRQECHGFRVSWD
jgi:hypothetical protein